VENSGSVITTCLKLDKNQWAAEELIFQPVLKGRGFYPRLTAKKAPGFSP
jgi:hypothetical protein